MLLYVDFKDKHLHSLKIYVKDEKETCLISTVFLWKLSWKLIDYINVFIEHDAKCTAWTTLSGVAVWQLSVVSNLWNSKINFRPNSKLQKTRQSIQKSSNRHALCHRRFGLSLSLSFGLCIALSFTVLGIIFYAPLCTVGAFRGTGTAKNSAWKWQTWKIQSLALSNRNCMNALASKSLIDDVVTDWKFQIVNSELEEYFKLKETVRVKLKEKPSPRPVIEKIK